jgi:hypothetical protein
MNRDTKRELTADEAKRNEHYEREKVRLEQEGYKSYDLTTSVLKSNVMAVVLVLPFVAIFTIIYLMVNNVTGWELFRGALDDFVDTPLGILLYFAIFFILVIVHELIHGVSRAMYAKSGWKSISFGFIAKNLTPYCACNEPLTKFAYIFGAMMPAVVLGFIPGIISIVIGNAFVFFMSMVMILSGGGDIHSTLVLLMFKTNGKKAIYIDHPYLIGLTAFVKE